MQLVKPTSRRFLFFILSFLLINHLHSQENSPFSRYGLGDLFPQQSVASRAMGGLTATMLNSQAVNTSNPATYGSIKLVTYDFGLSIDLRTLRSNDPSAKYNSANFAPAYLQLAAPVSKKNGIGVVFGLRPFSRINYSINENTVIDYKTGVTDTVVNNFEGNGGLNQAFLGMGKRWKSISLGMNFGYEFGSKNISSKVSFPYDTVSYYSSNSADTVHYGGFFVNPGFMANIKVREHTDALSKIKNTYYVNVGAATMLKQSLEADRSTTRQTFYYGTSGELVQQDSISKIHGASGHIDIPATYNAGISFSKSVGNSIGSVTQWSIGVEYSSTKWSDYRAFGEADQLNDSWTGRIGAEFSPSPLVYKGFWNAATYRVGYYRSKDYINADGNGYKTQAITFGGSFNLRKFRSYDNQFTMINTSVEIGKRGTSVNNVTENFFKLSLGLSLSDIWFIKRKYD